MDRPAPAMCQSKLAANSGHATMPIDPLEQWAAGIRELCEAQLKIDLPIPGDARVRVQGSHSKRDEARTDYLYVLDAEDPAGYVLTRAEWKSQPKRGEAASWWAQWLREDVAKRAQNNRVKQSLRRKFGDDAEL